MPSKKLPTKSRTKRNHPPARSKTQKPSDAIQLSATSDLHTLPAEFSLETAILPAVTILDAKRLLLQAKRYRLRRSERLGDAFRRIGLDESAVAAGYADALAKLQRGNADDAVEKSLLDILKECARILDPPRPADRSASIDVNTVVQLVHKVDRPLRQLPERATPVARIEATALVEANDPPVTITEEAPAAEDTPSQL